jgi:hypothetical protein
VVLVGEEVAAPVLAHFLGLRVGASSVHVGIASLVVPRVRIVRPGPAYGQVGRQSWGPGTANPQVIQVAAPPCVAPRTM